MVCENSAGRLCENVAYSDRTGFANSPFITSDACSPILFSSVSYSTENNLNCLAQEDGHFAIAAVAPAQNPLLKVAGTDNRWSPALVSSPHAATGTSDLYAMPAQYILPPTAHTVNYQHTLPYTPAAAPIQSLGKTELATATAFAAATTIATSAGAAAGSDLAPASWPSAAATSINTIDTYLALGAGTQNTNMMDESASVHDIIPSRLYQQFNFAPNMDNFSSFDNLMGHFQPLGSQPQPQAQQSRDAQHQPHAQHSAEQQQQQSATHPYQQPYQQQQPHYYQQSLDVYNRQQPQHQQHHQQNPLHQQYASQQSMERTGYLTDKKSPMTQVQNLLFDMNSFSGMPSDTATGVHSTPIQLAAIGSPANASNYPLSLDTADMRNPTAFASIGGHSYSDGVGNGSNSTIEDGLAMNAHNLVANLSLPSSALALSTPQPPGQVESNGSGYIGNPLGTPHSALPTAGGSQSLPQQGHAHVSTPFVQQMRPYNMMFGIHGLPEPRMLYDDRMSLPPLPHNGGNWLRIRQPIDYVAPLKKPMNSFLLYSAERRVQLRQTHPDLNTTQQSTILAREWASLPEEEKEKYRAEAKQLRDDYNARRAELSLKLQQQLNQQHLNMSLGHQPPPPLVPQHHHRQAPPHQQPLEMLDAGISSGDQHTHMHPAGAFGFQHPFSGPGMHMPHTQMSPINPGPPVPNQHTPTASFSQTPQEDVYAQTHALAADQTADAFQFEHALTSFDSATATGGSGHFSGFMIGKNTPRVLDATAHGGGYACDAENQSADSRWQEFNLAGSDSLRDNTAISQQYGLPRPPSSVSQYVNANDLGQQRFQQQRSYADADGLSSTMLNSSNGLFGTTFDSIIQPSDFGGGMPGFSSSGSKTLNHASSYASFSDASMLPRIHSALFDGEQEKSSELRRESNRDAPEHVNSHDTASQDPSSLSLGGVGGGGSSSAELAAASKQRARLSSPIKRARKKTKKDPDAPKHPMSAFLYFLTSERPRLAEQLSDMSIGQQTKIIAKQWKELDENDRAPWERLAKHDKDRYARERREYHSENRHTEAAAAAPN